MVTLSSPEILFSLIIISGVLFTGVGCACVYWFFWMWPSSVAIQEDDELKDTYWVRPDDVPYDDEIFYEDDDDEIREMAVLAPGQALNVHYARTPPRPAELKKAE